MGPQNERVGEIGEVGGGRQGMEMMWIEYTRIKSFKKIDRNVEMEASYSFLAELGGLFFNLCLKF